MGSEHTHDEPLSVDEEASYQLTIDSFQENSAYSCVRRMPSYPTKPTITALQLAREPSIASRKRKTRSLRHISSISSMGTSYKNSGSSVVSVSTNSSKTSAEAFKILTAQSSSDASSQGSVDGSIGESIEVTLCDSVFNWERASRVGPEQLERAQSMPRHPAPAPARAPAPEPAHSMLPTAQWRPRGTPPVVQQQLQRRSMERELQRRSIEQEMWRRSIQEQRPARPIPTMRRSMVEQRLQPAYETGATNPRQSWCGAAPAAPRVRLVQPAPAAPAAAAAAARARGLPQDLWLGSSAYPQPQPNKRFSSPGLINHTIKSMPQSVLLAELGIKERPSLAYRISRHESGAPTTLPDIFDFELPGFDPRTGMIAQRQAARPMATAR